MVCIPFSASVSQPGHLAPIRVIADRLEDEVGHVGACYLRGYTHVYGRPDLVTAPAGTVGQSCRAHNDPVKIALPDKRLLAYLIRKHGFHLGEDRQDGYQPGNLLPLSVQCRYAETDIMAALKRYGARRAKRVNRIARLARLVGQVVQMENPMLARARNAITKRLPTVLLMQ